MAAAAAAPTSKETLARFTFREICCRFGLPLNLTMDTDVRFNNGLWTSLWKMCGSKLKFTSSYHPQADPAERANRQVMEALRAAVATVTQYDEWDLAPSVVVLVKDVKKESSEASDMGSGDDMGFGLFD